MRSFSPQKPEEAGAWLCQGPSRSTGINYPAQPPWGLHPCTIHPLAPELHLNPGLGLSLSWSVHVLSLVVPGAFGPALFLQLWLWLPWLSLLRCCVTVSLILGGVLGCVIALLQLRLLLLFPGRGCESLIKSRLELLL